MGCTWSPGWPWDTAACRSSTCPPGSSRLFNEDGTVAIVFNGEIYNFQSLVPELQALGFHRFRTRSDTEVIVHAWEAWGADCVHRLRGMFAFALWDRRQQTLFLARDRMGVKPLHYGWLPDGSFIFGSELKVLTAHPAFDRTARPAGGRGLFLLRLHPRPALHLPPRPQAAGWPHAHAGARPSRSDPRPSRTGMCTSPTTTPFPWLTQRPSCASA